MFKVSPMLVPPRLNNESNMDIAKDKSVYMQVVNGLSNVEKT